MSASRPKAVIVLERSSSPRLARLGHLHPDKTIIGRIEIGFDFLGYNFGPDGLPVTTKILEKFIAHAIRLYEHEPGETEASSRFGFMCGAESSWLGLPYQ